MNDEVESDLRARFERWREQARAQAPEFERAWQRALRREREPPRSAGSWPPLRFAGAGVAALAVIAAGWLASHHPAGWGVDRGRRAWEHLLKPLEGELVSVDTAAWSAPTDFLLDDHTAESTLKR